MTGQFVTIDSGLRLHYEAAGQGERVILLLPGWTMSSEVFRRQFEFFEASKDYRFISLDPRAHGRSSKTADGHTYETHGRDLHAFIEALGLDDFILGGWSFGTLATLAYVNQFGSDRLSGFIMLDGPPRAAGEDNARDWVTYRYDDADGSQEFYSMGRLRDPVKNNRVFAAWMLEDRSEHNLRWLESITEQMPDSAAALLNATAVFLDYRDDLIALDGRIPLTYILRATQRETVENWRRQHTPNASLHAFGEHLMFWERSRQFNDILLEFARECWPQER